MLKNLTVLRLLLALGRMACLSITNYFFTKSLSSISPLSCQRVVRSAPRKKCRLFAFATARNLSVFVLLLLPVEFAYAGLPPVAYAPPTGGYYGIQPASSGFPAFNTVYKSPSISSTGLNTYAPAVQPPNLPALPAAYQPMPNGAAGQMAGTSAGTAVVTGDAAGNATVKTLSDWVLLDNLGKPVGGAAIRETVTIAAAEVPAVLADVAPLLMNAGKLNPTLKALLTAAKLGQLGYSLYQNFNSPANATSKSICGTAPVTGTSLNVDGSVSTQCAGDVSTTGGFCTINSTMTSLGGCLAACSAAVAASPSISCSTGSTISQVVQINICQAGSCGVYGGFNISLPPVSPPAVAWNNAQVMADIAASRTALGGITPAVDALGYAYKHGASLPVGMPSVPDVAQTTITAPPQLSTTSTDTAGNTTNTYKSPSVNIQPSATTGTPPVITPSVTTTTTVNGSPAGTTTTVGSPSQSPSISPLVPIGIGAGAGAGLAGVEPPEIDICLSHPEILACADITKLGDVASSVLPVSSVNITFSPVSVGITTAVCPPPIMLPPMGFFPGMSLDIFTPICNFASVIKFINVAAASLMGMLIVVGGIKQNG